MLVLTACLLTCHFLADFTHLSRPYMLKAKATGSPVSPIFEHALVHGCLMYLVMMLYGFSLDKVVNCFFLQIISHTIIDVCKGKLNSFEIIKNPTSPYHWYIFGIDQEFHQLVILLMVYILYQ